MSLDLESLISDASEIVAEASSLDALEAVRVELLGKKGRLTGVLKSCLLYTSPSPRDRG